MTDDVHPLVKALQRKMNHQIERIDEVEQELESLHETVAELSEVVNPDPGKKTYEELTKEQKVHKVRKKLLSLAINSNGRAAMKYRDVKRLFDGHPSNGHCYDLMERAGEMEGFEYDTNADDERRIRVESAAVKDETLVHAVKKDISTEVV